MPIVVSWENVDKLLAIPKLPGSGTGRMMGNAVVDELHQWTGVPELLAGLCFDTTSATLEFTLVLLLSHRRHSFNGYCSWRVNTTY